MLSLHGDVADGAHYSLNKLECVSHEYLLQALSVNGQVLNIQEINQEKKILVICLLQLLFSRFK